MAKYSEKTAKKILEFIEKDAFSISEICKIIGVSRKTFYEWMDTKSEFREGVEQAKEHCDEQLLMRARKAYRHKIDGYILTETIVTYVPDEGESSGFGVKKKVVKSKEYPPDTVSIRHIMERNDKCKDRKRPLGICVSADSKKTVEERILEFKRRSGFYSDDGKYIGGGVDKGLRKTHQYENVTSLKK